MRNLEALFRESKNPVYVWAALADYKLCQDSAPLPAWVMSYLREAALWIEMLADAGKPSAAVKRVNVVLGLTAPGKNRFADYRQDVRALNAAHIHDIRRELFQRPSGHPAKAEESNEWLAKVLGLKSEKPGRRSRRVGDLVARGRKLKAAMTK